MKTYFIYISIILFSIGLSSCKDEYKNPPNPNEEELITSVRLEFTNVNDSSDTSIFKFIDRDGEGGTTPEIFDTIRLRANSMYHCNIFFLDESDIDNIENITEEISKEAEDHILCFEPSGSQLEIQIEDLDVNGLELGLHTIWTTTLTEASRISIKLKHQPDIKNGTCDPGETDVELDFEYEIL